MFIILIKKVDYTDSLYTPLFRTHIRSLSPAMATESDFWNSLPDISNVHEIDISDASFVSASYAVVGVSAPRAPALTITIPESKNTLLHLMTKIVNTIAVPAHLIAFQGNTPAPRELWKMYERIASRVSCYCECCFANKKTFGNRCDDCDGYNVNDDAFVALVCRVYEKANPNSIAAVALTEALHGKRPREHELADDRLPKRQRS